MFQLTLALQGISHVLAKFLMLQTRWFTALPCLQVHLLIDLWFYWHTGNMLMIFVCLVDASLCLACLPRPHQQHIGVLRP